MRRHSALLGVITQRDPVHAQQFSKPLKGQVRPSKMLQKILVIHTCHYFMTSLRSLPTIYSAVLLTSLTSANVGNAMSV